MGLHDADCRYQDRRFASQEISALATGTFDCWHRKRCDTRRDAAFLAQMMTDSCGIGSRTARRPIVR